MNFEQKSVENVSRLLTIGMPTYNRSRSLNKMLSRLILDVGDNAKNIEIIISNNCSTDDTQNVIEKWVAQYTGDILIRTIKNDQNIGVVRNLISLFYLAQSQYFMFLGDDDGLNSESFSRTLELLLTEKPSAVIQASWNGILRTEAVGVVTFSDAASLFYEYGNAWAGIVDTQAAVSAIETRRLRQKTESTVWPQTVFGYLAMYDLYPTRKAYIVDYELGSPLTESLNITNKSYWMQSLLGLLRAALIIQQETGDYSIRNKFISLNCFGFLGHIKSIFWYHLFTGEQCSTIEIRKLLRRAFGLRGVLWSIVLKIEDYPRLLKYAASLAFWFVKKDRQSSFNDKLEQAKRQYLTEVANRSVSGKNFGNWFSV